MTISELDKLISDDIEAFRAHIQSHYPENSGESVAANDLNELGKQAFYVFNGMREHIIDYLKKM